jgi:hypothetical protein
MSLALTLIFYFFSRYYSIGLGVYSFLVSISSWMVWMYWAEARPYAQWFFLTTAQLLILIRLLKEEKDNGYLWNMLLAVSILLSLTIMFSAAQILVVSSALMLFIKNRKWLREAMIVGLPLGICYFYYIKSQPLYYWLVNPFATVFQTLSNALNASRAQLHPASIDWQLLNRAFPQEWLWVVVIYALIVFVAIIQKKLSKPQRSQTEIVTRNKRWIYVTGGMLITAVLILKVFQMWTSQGQGYDMFSISERYLIYLTPVGIIGVTLITQDVIEAFRQNHWMRLNAWIIFGGLLVISFLKVYMSILSMGLY